ncbi:MULTISPECIES: helix-turn-helix domain-containing protein [Frankia]|uniref:Regulatory protein n=1 Tax=Frankia alni (strain DSM 45986 / CECT 9034 / ACN14a) TaxID=326424 RepID=Q0RC82_FRAAA|nr:MULTISPECIES: helix-turn-helix transcriptional regulator [Frankia]CAJ64945.1 Putative regulatory protein [Frankia alni ACN14a]
MTISGPSHPSTPDPNRHPLAQIRAARGWSYQQLARLIAARARTQGIGMAAERQKVWRWEHRGVTPDRATQRILAEILGVPPEQRAARPWPAWLPTVQPAPCACDNAELRRELAEARVRLAELTCQAQQRPACRTLQRQR